LGIILEPKRHPSINKLTPKVEPGAPPLMLVAAVAIVCGHVVGEVGDELAGHLDAEGRRLLDGLSLGYSEVEREEGIAAPLDWLFNWVNEGQMLQIGEASQNALPVISNRNVVEFAIEDGSELRSLHSCNNKEMLAVGSNPLQRSDDVVSMNTINLGVDHYAFEHPGVRDRLLALPERGQTVDGAGGEEKIAVALVGLLGQGKKNIQLRLVRQRRATRERQATRAQEGLLWRLTGAPPAKWLLVHDWVIFCVAGRLVGRHMACGRTGDERVDWILDGDGL
jgi:hypothetical protein